MKVRGGRGREALCVYMPTDSNSVSVMSSLRKMCLALNRRDG